MLTIDQLKGVNDLSGNGLKISSGVELIGRRLERLLFEEENVFGDPAQISLIPSMMFDQTDEQHVLSLVDEVQYMIETFERGLRLSEINVQVISIPQDKTGVVINIVGEVEATSESVDVKFFKIKEKSNRE